MRREIAIVLGLVLSVGAIPTRADEPDAAAKEAAARVAVGTCAICHGQRGIAITAGRSCH